MPSTLPAILRAPRVPRDCPVTFVHLWRPTHGRDHLYSVHDLRGALVETIVGDDTRAEQRVHARYPWTSTQLGAAFGLPASATAWPVYSGEATAAEYRHRAALEPWSAHAPAIRALADRCERHAAVVEAIRRVRVDGTGDHPLDGPRHAVIYQRTAAHGGDEISAHLRRAMRAAERAGIVERVDDPTLIMPGGMPTGEIFGQYRATDSTPYTLGE